MELLDGFEKTVTQFPEAFPVFKNHKTIRKAVLNRNLSVYYRIELDIIEIIAVLDNRQDPGFTSKKEN